MSDSFHPELISAMLDGQLSPVQKAAVVEHLSKHPQDAALWDDLKLLRQQLRELPALSAPDDFKARVLRKIQDSSPTTATAKASVEVPLVRRARNHSAWLLACAASLLALVVAGTWYGILQNNTRLIAQNDRSMPSPRQPAGPENNPSNILAEPAYNEPTGDKQLHVSPSATETVQSAPAMDLPKPDAGVIVAPQVRALAGQVESRSQESIGLGIADATTRDRIESNVESPNARNRSTDVAGMGGGGAKGGEFKDPDDSLVLGAPQPTAELADSPAEAVAGEALPTDPRVRLDQLIVVQVPAEQVAEEWIAAAFRQANVQVDVSEAPYGFGQMVQLREESKKQAPAELEVDQALVTGEKQALDDRRDALGKSQPELSPATEYSNTDATTTAYWVDAEVQQIRAIVDHLDGAVIVGFPNPGNWGPRGNDQPQQKSYPANPALARRLGQNEVPANSELLMNAKEESRPQDAEPLSQAQRAIVALGLQNQPPTARYRILFVFHSSTSSDADKLDASGSVLPSENR